ncbi:MAG TPA: EAL domain-containing protein [Rhodocyclaceae bacterium]
MTPLSRLLRETSFSRQLSIVVAVAVLGLAFVSSLATSWQGSRQIHANLVEQGRQVTENLAGLSKLALLYDAPDNAAEAVRVTLAFPDVTSLEIRHVDGRLLVGENNGTDRHQAQEAPPRALGSGAFLESESGDAWRFVAPVTAGTAAPSPFDTGDKPQELLGYVRVTKSKATLTRMHAEVFAINFAVSFFFAFVVLLIVRLLTARMTRPLTRLSAAMAQAEAGAAKVRAELAGPKDIVDMALAFNRMIAVLEEREAELREARDNALKFAKLKADFAATVSHEIRTPLNGVVGTLDILMAADLPPRQRQFVEIAWDSSQYLLDLINNILDFSKLEADKVVLERAEFGLAHMVEDVIELLSPQSAQKGLDLGYLVAPEVPPRLLGDPRRLRQVLINLVGNAIKFTESGGVEVSVAAEPAGAASDEPVLRFEVSDTGIGISADAQRAIFDSFTQADTSTTRRFGGTGLGLAICKQLVGLMGGAIGVDSAPGKGSRFWFTVPLGVAGPPAQPLPRHPSWPGLRALVADESEIARRFLQQALASWGFDCGTADDADSALAELRAAKLRGAPYHLVIVDTVFSIGGESLPLLIHREFQNGLKLVLMNRYGAEHVPAAVQADAYLAKPLCLDRLLDSIAGAMGDGKRAVEAGDAPADERRGWRVLVVEDNHTNQVIAEGMLGVFGCEVGTAMSGQEGLLAFKRERWDLIFMDCNMPGMDGYQVTAAIRSLEEGRGRRTPIVAMTANVQASDIEKCLASGMDDHLAKPLTLEHVGEKLERWIPGFVAQAAAPLLPPARVAGGGDEPIDPTLLGRLREALGSAIGLAIQPFLEDMPAYLEEMEQAIAMGDAEALRRAAHAVKGAAGNLGAAQLSSVAREIEELAEAALVSEAGERLAEARAEYALVQQALLDELKSEPEAVPEDASKGALVLIVDDDRSTRSALRYALQRSGFTVEEAVDGARALALIERMVPDVVLMDALMPEMDGFTACARLQETPRGKDIPVLMITALDDHVSIERAFAAGASDYIPKPINLAVVNQRVRRVVEANRAEKHVRRLAFNDTLTGLPNRVLFAENLNRAIERAESASQSLAVLFLDLDRFKFVNDTLGHEIGDRLLKAVASRIKYCVRSTDCVARLGGDEFTVLLDELHDPAFAANVAQKICRTLAAAFEIDGQEIFVSASIGISVFPTDGGDVSTLLRHADTAMYRAKRGSGGFEFYEAGMEALVSDHLRLDTSLRRAIERQELRVFYQPKADAATGRITGMEALVRWQHPERGMISPLEFIPLAEETGLIVSIGAWVLRTACMQTRAWVAAGAADLNVAVNLSGVQLAEGGFAEVVRTVLRETGLEARHLTLEITESVLMEHAREAVSTLRELKEIGLRVEIDDFGTGYSSLAYLKRFPVDALKIDRTFTRDMTTNPDDAAIVTGIIALAHSLRLKVVAEGVETREQLDCLVGLGCDSIQGYYLAEPLPADDFERRILRAASRSGVLAQADGEG